MNTESSNPIALTEFQGALVLFPGCDPLGLMRDAFLTRSLASVRAEDLILAWLLSLPDEMDPAGAAHPVLSVFAYRSPAPTTEGRSRLTALLEEITLCPREQLLAERDGRRRRRRPSA